MKPKKNKDPAENRQGNGIDGDGAADPMLSELETEKKWLQFARVDIEQFELLYQKYYPKIFRSVFLMVQDEDVASNLTDETFSRAVDKLDSFRWQGYTFGAWLYMIARNVVRHDLRHRQSKPAVSYDPEKHDCDNGSRPDTEVEQLDDSRILMVCLNKMQPIRKEVFVNRYGMGLKVKEIAVVMSMPELTVKSHLQRGRKQLQKCLIANGVERGLSTNATKIVRKSIVRDDGWTVLEDRNETLTEENISRQGEEDPND